MKTSMDVFGWQLCGGLNYIQKTPEGKYVFISSRNNLKGFPYDRCYRVRHITSDKKGNIWVGSSDGALSFKEDFKIRSRLCSIFMHVSPMI